MLSIVLYCSGWVHQTTTLYEQCYKYDHSAITKTIVLISDLKHCPLVDAHAHYNINYNYYNL